MEAILTAVQLDKIIEDLRNSTKTGHASKDLFFDGCYLEISVVCEPRFPTKYELCCSAAPSGDTLKTPYPADAVERLKVSKRIVRWFLDQAGV